MHCIGELIEPIAAWPGFMYGASTVCRAAATAAIILSDPIATMRSGRSKSIGCGPSLPSAYAAIACTMLPTNARSCGRVGAKPGASSQHQTTASAAASMSATL